MKIDSSVIGMESARVYRSQVRTTRQFMIQKEEKQEQEGPEKQKGQGHIAWNYSRWQGQFSFSARRLELEKEEENTAQELHQVMVKWILEVLFHGRKRTGELQKEQVTYPKRNTGPEEGSAGQGLRVVQETRFWEEEHTSFASSGTVKTKDGREISFQVEIGFSRSFEACFSREIRQAAPRLCDPLVINFDTDCAAVGDQRIYFDLDQDGREEEINTLTQGSGFLALDKNEDGRIGDGGELFGTKSGDGFRDLAQFDQDGNGWIDENDEIWKKLKIWTKDAQGKETLYSLAEKGVGAIYLGSAGTDFTMRDSGGEVGAMVRKTGIFLYESGQVGTIQHLDLACHEAPEETE